MKIKPRAQSLLAAAVLALAGLAATMPGAQAAIRPASTPALHGTRIALGATTELYGNAFAQAPNGAVFFSRGAVVYVVEGDRAPGIALRAGHTVFALAATNTDLFVETGLLVTEYSRANGKQIRHWALPRTVAAVTSAGLYVFGNTVWAWTDWATDESGFQYAQLDRLHTNGAAVRVIDKDAMPGDMAADGAGLYFETVHGLNDYLARANPTTSSVLLRKTAIIDAPLALVGGRLDELAFGDTQTIVSYNATTLARVSSKRVAANDDSIVGTGLGLLVLDLPCSGFPCNSASVARLNSATGGAPGALRTPGAYQLLNGPAAAVVEATDVHGSHANMFLVRISS